jgi:capsular exopolysaccharide synthesis family protein
MGKNELEPKPAGGPWPIAEQGAGGMAVRAADAYPGYGAPRPSEFNLNLVWQVLWMWRWLILGAAAAGVAGAVVVTLLTTPLYRSSVMLELNPPAVEVMEEKGSGSPMLGNDRQFLATQYGLLQSRALAERVAQDLNLASNPALASEAADREVRQRAVVDTLTGGLRVEPEPESRLVRISFSSADPQLAASVVNGFAESFINSSLERRYQASSYAREFLQRQINLLRQELENAERQLVAYAQQQGIISGGGGGAAGGEGGGGGGGGESTSGPEADTLKALNSALSQATARRIAAEQRYRQGMNARPTVEVTQSTTELRNQLAGLQAEYQDKLQIFQPDYPDMVRLRSRMQAIEQSIRSEVSVVRAGQTGTLQAEYQAAIAEERALQTQVQQLRGAVLNLRGRSIQYNILQRDLDQNRALYDALLQRYKEIGIAGGVGQTQASIIDRGEVPTSPYKPNLILNVLIGLGLGLLSGIGIAFLLEFLNDTIKSPEDVRDKLRLAYIGGVPPVKGGAIEELRDTSTAISEAYFSAMTALQFSTETGAPQVLLLTSTRPAEGKSTSSWALANSFARLGRKVLLIDADMRKPAFVTGEEKKDGFANLLTNRDPLMSHVVKPESADGVWLLPCGPLPPNPAELLSSARLQTILAEARSQFDLIIIDSPPILGLADTPLLSALADGTMMVIEAGRTRTRAAGEAVGRLRQSGANVVGALLTRYKHDAVGYGYSYDAYRYSAVENRSREIRLIVSKNG